MTTTLRESPSGPQVDVTSGIQAPSGQIGGTNTDPLIIGITDANGDQLTIGAIPIGAIFQRVGDAVEPINPGTAGNVLTSNGTTWLSASASAFSITAFAAVAPVVEIGITVVNPSFTAAQNHPPTSLVLTNNDNSESKNVLSTPTAFHSDQSYVKTANNATVTFTLAGSDGITPATRNTTISWRPYVYHGIGPNGLSTEADIKALATAVLQASRATSYTDNATGSNYLYWAAPTSYGTPTFTVGGFSGGFSLVSNTIALTLNGITQNCQLWQSDTAGLGSTPVVVS